MGAKKSRAKISKSDWFEAALELLLAGGINNVSIEKLSRTVGVAKTSFYWHFKDREELLNLMLKYWASLFTVAINTDSELLAKSNTRALLTIVERINNQQLFRYDLAIRAWAVTDDEVANKVQVVYQQRLNLIRVIFGKLGFKQADLERRARLFMTFFTWENYMMFKGSPEHQLAYQRHCLQLLLT
jgi:AcrR family transcriptional regulator